MAGPDERLAASNCPRELLRARISELEAEVARLRSGLVHRTGWTAAEDAIVRNGYERQYKLAVIRSELIARGFRARSLGGISGRAQHLGCSSAFAPNAWTAEQDEVLRSGYSAGATYAEIRRRLLSIGCKRNRSAIGMRAIAIGISGERANPWTETETRIALAGLHAGKLFREIEAELRFGGFERSKGSLNKFARRHGCSRVPEGWTENEELILRARYAAKTPVGEISRELGRGIGAITSKASKLGIKQRERRTLLQRAA